MGMINESEEQEEGRKSIGKGQKLFDDERLIFIST